MRDEGRTARWVFGVQGVVLAIGAMAAGGIGWIVLGLLAPLAEHLRGEGTAVEPFVLRCLDRREMVLIPALAAAACGAALLLTRRGRLLWLGLGTVMVVAIVVLILYCFIRLVGPLYAVPPASVTLSA